MTSEITQGPKAGRHWPAEQKRYEDPETGAIVTRLTDYPGSDNRHLYFTEDGWYDDGRRLLVRGYREGVTNLYSVDLETGLLAQVTDLPQGFTDVARSPAGPEVYGWSGDTLVGVDLHSLDVWPLYEFREAYENYSSGMPGVTADGETVCLYLVEQAIPRPSKGSGNHPGADEESGGDGSAEGGPEENESKGTEGEGTDDDTYASDRVRWMARMHEANPHSVVLAVPSDGDGEPEVLLEEDTWLGHVNPSPTDPDLLTYCEEGPWDLIEDRIRGYDRETGETWSVRPMEEDRVAHEFWLADGERVGYHGWRGPREDPDAFFGIVDARGGDPTEVPVPDLYTHVQANDTDLVVCDGTHRGIPHLLVWRETAEDFEGPRKLATHGWSSDDDAHPHARVGPGNETVAFDSTRGGDGSDVYLVDVPEFDALPPLSDWSLDVAELPDPGAEPKV